MKTTAGPIMMAGPAYSLGDLLPMEQAVAAGIPSGLLDRLRTYGFAYCSVSERSPSALAAESARSLFSLTGVCPADVDAVVYATCSHRSEPSSTQERAVREGVLEPLELSSARLFGVWLGESGNLVSAFRLARSLLVARGMTAVLILVADGVPKLPGEYRAMPNAVTINGDGAAACLLSTWIPGSYRLEGIGQVASPAMCQAGRRPGLREYLEFMAGVKAALALLYQTSGTSADCYQWMVTNNYSETNISDFAGVAGIPSERVFRDNVSRHGHAFTADGLINLFDLTESADIHPGERVLVLSTGPFSWGAIGFVRSTNR